MLLNSKFDLQTVDSPISPGGLFQTLAVASPPNPSFDVNGTPVPGVIYPGMVVAMNSSGLAVLATAPDLAAAFKILPFIVIDGNVDFGGSYVQVLTVVQGGVTIVTDQYNAGTYTPGTPVTFSAGKFSAITYGDTHQQYGFVGPLGLDTTNGILQVIIPQGAGV